MEQKGKAKDKELLVYDAAMIYRKLFEVDHKAASKPSLISHRAAK